jgi:hypothetical protein
MLRKLHLLLLCLAGCSLFPLHHVDPAPRAAGAQDGTIVRVDVDCVTEAPFKTGEPDDPHQFDSDIEWYPHRVATGVVVSERHVLTVAHAVRCPDIPTAVITLPNGKQWLVEVTIDAQMFGDGTDLARLELIGDADRFGLGVAPPRLARIGDRACVLTRRGRACGDLHGPYVDAPTYKGDSGSPVYDMGGDLIGLVTSGDDAHTVTRFVRVTPWWLKGT